MKARTKALTNSVDVVCSCEKDFFFFFNFITKKWIIQKQKINKP